LTSEAQDTKAGPNRSDDKATYNALRVASVIFQSGRLKSTLGKDDSGAEAGALTFATPSQDKRDFEKGMFHSEKDKGIDEHRTFSIARDEAKNHLGTCTADILSTEGTSGQTIPEPEV
jgi:hypothetical protein